MPLALIEAHDEVTLCHADDPSSNAPKGSEGWIPVDECKPSEDATTITVFALNGWEMMQCRSAASEDDQEAFAKAVIARGLIAIDGDKDKAQHFLESPHVDWVWPVFTAILDAAQRPLPGGGD